MNTLLFDFNNLAIRCFFGMKDVEPESENPDYELWEYLVFKSIYWMLYKERVNEVVLAVDDSSWRKKIFPEYKAQRKDKREESKVDWGRFYSVMEDYLDEIKTNLPFKVLKTKFCEADDIIGVLGKNKENCIVVSADSDYLQLSDTCKIYHPFRKKYVFTSDTERFITELCLKGQAKDNIFNIKTPIDYPKEKRKPSMGDKQVQKILNEGLDKFLKQTFKYKFEYENKKGENCKYEGSLVARERFELNKKLLDFNCIPEILVNKTLNNYYNYSIKANPDNLYSYFTKKNWRECLDDFDKFESKLLELY